MANDRMFMRCRVCGEMIGLGKHFGDGWYNAPAGDALQEWIDKHAPVWMHEGEYDESVKANGGHAVFEIVYESDDDYPFKTARIPTR